MTLSAMIDLETMSSNMDAAIASIGAVVFDPSGPLLDIKNLDEQWPNALEPTYFYVNVDLKSCLAVGLKADADTIYWWLSQSDEARKALKDPPPIKLSVALGQLKQWLSVYKVQHIWAHANFDLSILHTAYIKIGEHRVPWSYFNARDVRTIYALAFGPDTVPGVPISGKHNALYDAVRQAIGVQTCWKKLNDIHGSLHTS